MSLVDSPRVRTVVTLGLALASLGAAPALHAQRGGKQCDAVNDESTESMGGRLFLSRATDPKMTNQASKDSLLHQAVGSLTSSKMNEQKDIGRAYLLAEALVLEAANPATATVGPRGGYGYKSDSATQIDILATSDTLLTVLAKKSPECASLADNIRQQAYVPLTNAAIQDLNTKNYGGADTLAHRALTIYNKSPYVYNALGSVAITKHDYADAKENFNKVIQLAGTDTSLKRMKTGAMYNLAVVSSSIADSLKGSPQHQAYADSAVAAWKAYQAANPSDPNAQAGLTHALQASGDTAQAKALYADMLNNPGKYSDMQLFNSAISAARDKDEPTAVKLFQSGMKTNPYFREALYYVANSEFNNGQVDSLMPTVRRLVSIDPNNPDDYRLLAGAYQLRARDASDPKTKRAMQDSTLQALKKFQQPKVSLTVTNFANDGEHIALAGRLTNFDTAQAHTYAPKFSFIDASGNVVGQKQSDPVNVPAKGNTTFQLSTPVKGAVAYKYDPLD
jgi:Flp pilus assembly protein TadD